TAILVNVSEDRISLAIKVATSIHLPGAKRNRASRLTQTNSRSSMSISNFINKEVKKIGPSASVSSASKDPLLDEIIQYTSLDVNFSLGEINFVLFKSSQKCETSPDVSIEFLTPDGDVLPSQLIENVQEPIEELPRTPPQQILSIDIRRLEAHFVSKTYESVATVKLGDINLRQYDCQDSDMDVLDVIHTPKQENSSNYLFTVSCTIADKSSPEFSTKYNSTEQLVVANFEVLQVVLHQECLQRIMEVSNNFQRNLDVVLSSTRPRDRMGSIGGGDGIKRKLNVILEDTEEIMTTDQMKRRKKTRRTHVVETVKVRVIANLDQVGLVLTSRNRPIAEMNVKKFVSSLIIKSSYTEVNIGLKDIQVLDLNPHTIHKNILSIVGKDAFNCQIVIYNKEETQDYNSDDMKITVDIGCMKIIFLNWFVAGVMNFLNNFTAAQATISQAGAAAAESARQKAMDAYETATRMKLNIRIKAPIIIVPIGSQDRNALMLDLGLLELTNNTVEVAVAEEERLAVIDEIKLQICDVKISKIVLLDGNESTVDGEGAGLARFGIYFLSVKGTKLDNGTLSTSVVLCNIQMDDMRSNSKSQIRQYLSRKDWVQPKLDTDDIIDACYNERNFMVDVTAIIKEDDTFAEVRVRGFDLIVCIDFLLKLTTFLTLPPEENPRESLYIKPAPVTETARDTKHSIRSSAILAAQELVPVEPPKRREMTRHYILHPCVISLQGSTPEEEGMHISLKLSDIIMNVSPATIELLNKAMLSVSSGTMTKCAIAEESRNYSNLWQQRHFHSRSYWFTKVEQGVDALEAEQISVTTDNEKQKTEKCVIEIPSITLVIESGVGYYTKPLISLDTRITAVFNNWSRSLTAHGSLTLNMPIIELNEVIGRNGVREYTPWELKFEMGMEKVQSEVEDDAEQQAMHMNIHSAETLEITLSKTCLGLMSELAEAFSQAIDQNGLTKPDIVAPYVLENDTGFDVNLNLRKGIFTLHEVHRGGTPVGANSTLLMFAQPEEVDPSVIKTCTISTGGKAYLQTKDLSTLSEEDSEDYTLYVTIGDINKEIALPVSKSDTRFFNLMRSTSHEPWGIISEVKQEYGTTKVNIHGVVSVHNHFTTGLNIYRRNPAPTAQCFEDIFVGRVRPGEVFHVPLHAIYSESKDLFFSMRGYRRSVQGISWASNPSDLNYSHQLHCDPTNTFEPLIMNARRSKSEVYFENTNKYTLLSAFYTIHLRPPLYLRNSLPINIQVSVAGCSVRKEDGLDAQSSQRFVDRGYSKEDFLDYGEKPVNSGDVLHLPTVRLASKGKESKSFLVVRLVQYLEKDWSCATEIWDYTDDVITWTFSSYDSEMKVDMDLYVKTENRHGSLMLTLFSPFWMINKTGMMLTYKSETTSVEVLYHPPEYSGPILFTFRDKLFFDKKKASIRIDNGQWSEKIPLDVAGSVGEVICFANNQKYPVGVHNHLTQNSLTKQITFIPFYIVCNKCHFDIELQEQSRPADPWLHLEPNEMEPLWPRNENKNNLVVRVDGKITPAFDFTEVICTLLKLEDSKYGGINVDVQTTEGGVYITFTDYKPADAPGLLINHTGKQIVYYEKGTKNEHILNAKSTIMYAWDDPTGPKMLVFGTNKEETDLKRDGIGEVIMQDGEKVLWVSFLDGLQRVLLFTENESIANRTESTASLQSITQSIDLRIHGIGLSVINNETGLDILYLGVTSSGIIWESKKVTKNRFKELTINENALLEIEYQKYLVHKSVNDLQTYRLDNKFPIDFDLMILKKSGERNLRRSFYPAIWLSRKSSPFQSQLHVKINRIQVDNQFLDPIFPVVLAPIPPPKSVASTTSLKPFIECSMVQRIMPNSTVRQFKYARILIQEFLFKVDLNFLTAIAEMFAKEVSDEAAAKQFRQDVESIELPLSAFFEEHSLEEQKSFYDNLHLGPLKIHVSFSMAGSDTKALPGFLGSLVQGVGVTLTDVNDVVFRLAFFEREYQFFSQQQLINEITSHYTGQALKQLYVLVLGLDVLGNPYGLVVGLKKGVEDLFYEPFQGAIQGPGEFAEGLVLGVKSLFGHTVGGAAGAVSKITGAMGKGLAALTFDEDYQKKRRQGIQNKPKNFHEGLARSSKGLVMGFVDGVSGVVTKPVIGARDNGVEGFFKGLGKGAIGLVARPTAGVVDFASGSFEAVKRAADASEDVKRMRPPRFQHYDFVLRPYCLMEATGNKIMKETDKGKFATTDNFIHCEEIIQKSEYLVVTNYRVMYVQRNEMFGVWTSLWSYLWNEISSVTAMARGVQFTVKTDGKKVLGLFSSKESPRKLVLVGDERKRDALVNIIESQRSDPNPLRATIAYPAHN
ncbi:GM20965, partial [Drosophila sechellia]